MADLIPRAARRNPDGFVAQRILDRPESSDIRGPWLLTYLDDAAHIAIQVLTDDDVVTWPTLLDNPRPAPGDVLSHAEWFFRQAGQPNTGSDTERAFGAIVAEMDRLRARIVELEVGRG